MRFDQFVPGRHTASFQRSYNVILMFDSCSFDVETTVKRRYVSAGYIKESGIKTINISISHIPRKHTTTLDGRQKCCQNNVMCLLVRTHWQLNELFALKKPDQQVKAKMK